MPLTQAQQAHADTLTDEDLVDLARARDEAAVRTHHETLQPPPVPHCAQHPAR